jgi:hypothetical protein
LVGDGGDSAEAVVVNTHGDWAVHTCVRLTACDSDEKSNHIRRHCCLSKKFPYPGTIPRDGAAAAVEKEWQTKEEGAYDWRND